MACVNEQGRSAHCNYIIRLSGEPFLLFLLYMYCCWPPYYWVPAALTIQRAHMRFQLRDSKRRKRNVYMSWTLLKLKFFTNVSHGVQNAFVVDQWRR